MWKALKTTVQILIATITLGVTLRDLQSISYFYSKGVMQILEKYMVIFMLIYFTEECGDKKFWTF